MSDIFGKKKDKEITVPKTESVLSYIETYHRLVRDYSAEIQFIENMMQELRKEREEFYLEKLPEIKKLSLMMMYQKNTVVSGYRKYK